MKVLLFSWQDIKHNIYCVCVKMQWLHTSCVSTGLLSSLSARSFFLCTSHSNVVVLINCSISSAWILKYNFKLPPPHSCALPPLHTAMEESSASWPMHKPQHKHEIHWLWAGSKVNRLTLPQSHYARDRKGILNKRVLDWIACHDEASISSPFGPAPVCYPPTSPNPVSTIPPRPLYSHLSQSLVLCPKWLPYSRLPT